MYKNHKKCKKVQPGSITCCVEYSRPPLQRPSPEWSLLLLQLLLLAELTLLLFLLRLPRFFPDCLLSSFLCSFPGSLPSAEEAVEEEDELERGVAPGPAQRSVSAALCFLSIRFVRIRVLFEASKNNSERYECIACSVTFLWVSDKLLTTGSQGNTTSWPHMLWNLNQNSPSPIPASQNPCFPMPFFHTGNPSLHL